MNVLLLTADSLRTDRTTLFGHSRDTTPFLAELAGRSVEFRLAYSNGFNTSSSFPAIHTSTHQSYYDGVGIPASGTPTLAEILSAGGYATHAINTNELVSREYNYARGFDVYRDSRAGASDNEEGGWRSAARDLVGDGLLFEAIKRAHFLSTEHLGVKIFDTADAVSAFEDTIVDWTTGTSGDWFVWAHYMNPHHPYEPPEACQVALGLDPVSRRKATRLSRKMRLHPEDVTKGERRTLRGLYDASVLSWDREIESTYRTLERAGQLEDTLVVVTADHGELLGENGRYGHPPVLDQQLLRIPLVFSGAPVDAGRSNAQVGLIDLAPTIATLCQCDVPEDWNGRVLFDVDGSPRTLEDEVQFSEVDSADRPMVAAVDDDRKIVHDIAADRWRSFELHDDRRLTEKKTSVVFEDLLEAVRRHDKAAAENIEDAASVDGDQLREDLAALGYLDE